MNPYLSIWFQPQKTIQKTLSEETVFNVAIPVVLSSLSAALGQDLAGSGFWGSILIILITFIVCCWMLGKVMPWLLMKTGRLMRGKGHFKEIQLIVSLAQIPVIPILILQLIHLSTGHILEQDEIFYGIQFIGFIFYSRILIFGLSKTQGFSFGMAIVNILLPLLPLVLLRLVFL